LTSNLAGSLIQSWEGKDRAGLKERVEEGAQEAFRPEFLNRIDEIVLFNRLDRDDLLRIVDIQAARLAGCCGPGRSRCRWTPALRRHLATRGTIPSTAPARLKRTMPAPGSRSPVTQAAGGTLDAGDDVRATGREKVNEVVFRKKSESRSRSPRPGDAPADGAPDRTSPEIARRRA